MCRIGYLQENRSVAHQKQVIQALIRSFHRRRGNKRATLKLVQKEVYYRLIGINIGTAVYFIKNNKPSKKKGEYKLFVRKIKAEYEEP
jgi:hypothetical protein